MGKSLFCVIEQLALISKLNYCMNKIVISLIVLILSLAVVKAEEIKTVSTKFDDKDFVFSYDNSGALEITSYKHNMSYGENLKDPGLPLIPLNVLIQKETAFNSMKVSTESRLLMEDVIVAAIPEPVITSNYTAGETVLEKPHYENKTYPSSCSQYVGTSNIDGYIVLHFLICPFEYDAASKKLYLHEQVTLEISLDKSLEKSSSAAFGRGNNMRDIVKRMVVNPEEMDEIYQMRSASLDEDSVEYVIITTSALASSFQPIAQWKKMKGVKSEIITIEDIETNYSGATTPIKIKSCLYDLYQNKGLRYALLGGDDSVVPVQGCYGKVLTKDGYVIDSLIPTDIFFACFGGNFSWDANGNGVYGELTDSADMAPSIYVTRAPIRSVSDVEAFSSKLLTYEKDPIVNGWGNNILMSGCKLSSLFNSQSDSEYYGDSLYSTFIGPNWSGTRTKLYDTNTDFPGGPNYDLDYYSLQPELRKGYTFFDMISHGGHTRWRMEPDSCYYFTTNAQNLINNRFTIITTIACQTNYFDFSIAPCLSEAFIRNPNSGVIAYLGCSRFGWYYANSKSFGSSLKYNSYFYQKLFSGNIRNKNFGAIVAEAKMLMKNSCTYYGPNRWVQFGLNPIGDPEMPIYTTTPIEFEDCLITYGDNCLTVDTGVDSCTVCVMSSDDNGVSYYQVQNNIQTATFTSIPSDVSICVTKQNYIPKVFYSTIYIQNETVTGSHSYEANVIKVGSSVTSSKPAGPVHFDSDSVELKANRIIIGPKTTINRNTFLNHY